MMSSRAVTRLRQLSTCAAQAGSSTMLSDLTVHAKYARFLPDLGRREVWPEIVARNEAMHMRQLAVLGAPAIAAELSGVYDHVRARRVLPSMRSLQFGGAAIEGNNARMFNCSFLPLNRPRAFAEAMFLLLCGTGVGFSVQRHHVAALPRVRHPDSAAPPRVHVVADSIDGWAEAADALVNSYLPARDANSCSTTPAPSRPVQFDFSLVRPRGAPLVTAGGRAPGPDPLRDALESTRATLSAVPDGAPLPALAAHDMLCHLATAVASGGVRRSALISLFSPDDDTMVAAKAGEWWTNEPQRAMANNSAVLDRSSVTRSEFDSLWGLIRDSGAGEPGVYFTNDREWGTNPCCEVALEPFQFCNLTEVNVSRVSSQAELDELVRAAAFIGTLQASYTDFKFLDPRWAETTRRAALLGVSMTGIASGNVMQLDLERAARGAADENARVADHLGLPPADRVTTVKPAGTTSLVLGTSSGVHAWHAPYYIRRMRINKEEAIYDHLLRHHPALMEDDVTAPDRQAVLSFPQRAPPGAVLRGEPALALLERVRHLHTHWIRPGHRRGANTNNVSTTVSVRPEEWDAVGEWMWRYRDSYNGLCVLPYSSHTYRQAPFEECDKATYERLAAHAFDLDLTAITEEVYGADFGQAPACAGGSCEL